MFKKGMFLLCVLTASLILLPLATVVEAADIPLSGLTIEEDWVSDNRAVELHAVKDPSNANGTFEYRWSCNDASWELIRSSNGDGWIFANAPDGDYEEDYYATVTLTVTQTLPSGRTVTKQLSRSLTSRGYQEAGACNAGFGLFAAAFAGLAVLYKRRY